MHSDSWGWGFFGHGFGIVFWIILIAVAVTFVAGLVNVKGRPSSRSPKEILKERYARGEIEREEYEQKLKDLER